MTDTRKRFRHMTPAEQREHLETGKGKLRNTTFVGSDFRRLCADNCTIRGDNNHVFGNHNHIVGRNNRSTGNGNIITEPVVEPPPPPPAGERTPIRASTISGDQQSDLLIGHILSAIFPHAQVMVQPIATTAARSGSQRGTKRPRGKKKFLPEEDEDPRQSNWKQSALDLPDGATVCDCATCKASRDDPDVDPCEMVCNVCAEKKRDVCFEPCHHTCCCRDCVKTMVSKQNDPLAQPKCPKCREPVEFMSIIYL